MYNTINNMAEIKEIKQISVNGTVYSVGGVTPKLPSP